MEPFIYIFFALMGVIAVVSVIVGLKKIVGGSGSAGGSTDGETERLCKTLDGDELYKLAQGLVDEKGYKTSYDKWEKYTLAAANKGNIAARREIGAYYRYDKNKLAIDWLQRAADAGDDKAAVILGEIYQYGLDRGIPKIEKDREKAVEVYRGYAEKGIVGAQKKLAYCLYYYFKEKEEALKWYLEAANAGDVEAMLEASHLYMYDGEDKKSFDIMLKAAETGYPDAECSVGNYYSDLENPDFDKAFEWYIKSAEHGYSFAMCRAGEMYLAGEGVLKDANKAFEWFQKAMDGGSVYGEYLVGRCYMNGDGVEQNNEKAIRHYTEAAKYDSDAQYALAECYLEGNGVKKDTKKAVELLLKSAEDGLDGSAANKLGELYYAGEGVKKDEKAARGYWLKAARDGNKDAMESLKIYFDETVGDE